MLHPRQHHLLIRLHHQLTQLHPITLHIRLTRRRQLIHPIQHLHTHHLHILHLHTHPLHLVLTHLHHTHLHLLLILQQHIHLLHVAHIRVTLLLVVIILDDEKSRSGEKSEANQYILNYVVLGKNCISCLEVYDCRSVGVTLSIEFTKVVLFYIVIRMCEYYLKRVNPSLSYD